MPPKRRQHQPCRECKIPILYDTNSLTKHIQTSPSCASSYFTCNHCKSSFAFRANLHKQLAKDNNKCTLEYIQNQSVEIGVVFHAIL